MMNNLPLNYASGKKKETQKNSETTNIYLHIKKFKTMDFLIVFLNKNFKTKTIDFDSISMISFMFSYFNQKS